MKKPTKQMKRFSIIIMSLLLFGCSAEKQLQKRIKKAQVVAYENPSEFSQFCSKLFPIIPTYVKGRDSVIERTVVVKGDSIPCPENQGKIVYVKCPDAKVIYRDVWRTDTIIKESTARVDSINRKLSAVSNDLVQMTNDKVKAEKVAQIRLYWLIGIGIIGLLYVFVFRRFL